MDKNMKSKLPDIKGLSRRTFLKHTGTILFVVGSSGHILNGCREIKDGSQIAISDGYLVVDVEKCQGCISCVLACSLVHEGALSPSLARIQILQDSFGKFPVDLSIEQCRQCEAPACLEACPENALTANAEFGNVRMVDKEKCTGCGSCFKACPYTPARLSIVEDETFNKARNFLQTQLSKSRVADYETKAVLLHSLSVAGSADFTLANQLYRNRPSLSAAALAYLQVLGHVIHLVDVE